MISVSESTKQYKVSEGERDRRGGQEQREPTSGAGWVAEAGGRRKQRKTSAAPRAENRSGAGVRVKQPRAQGIFSIFLVASLVVAWLLLAHRIVSLEWVSE